MTTEEGLWKQKFVLGFWKPDIQDQGVGRVLPLHSRHHALPSVWRLSSGWACGHIALTSVHIVTSGLPALCVPVFTIRDAVSDYILNWINIHTVAQAVLELSPQF